MIGNRISELLLAASAIVAAVLIDRTFRMPLIGNTAVFVLLIFAGVRVWRSRNRDLTDLRYRTATAILAIGLVGICIFKFYEISEMLIGAGY